MSAKFYGTPADITGLSHSGALLLDLYPCALQYMWHNRGCALQDEEAQVMNGLAWATVGELEPQVHHLEQSIEHGMPGKLLKIEACLGPALQKVKELEKMYQGQVGHC